MAKKSKIKLELYARYGDTLYDVSKYDAIVTVLTASMPVINELFKLQQLPHKVFVKNEDLLELNRMIFGITSANYFKIYLSTNKDAQAILQFDDVDLAPREDLYEVIRETDNSNQQ